MTKSKIQANDETNISEITISPDGRVFVFGASEPLLDLFAELGWQGGLSSFNRDSRRSELGDDRLIHSEYNEMHSSVSRGYGDSD